MNLQEITKAYDFSGKTIAITGGGGVLCGAMAKCLAGCNANVVILDRDMALGEKVLQSLQGTKGKHKTVFIDVLDKAKVQEAADRTLAEYGKIDILINGAGGNNPKATTSAEMSFFDIPTEAIQFVSNLNLIGTILPSQIFGKQMVVQKEGIILNVSSMNAFRPLTRIPAYSAAKAAISNFTQWLAVHFSKTGIRVNAIAPGFLLTNQNRFLLIDEKTGGLTPRGKKIINGTPMERYCVPEELTGTLLYLVSDLSKFVTGVVIPVDGGFSAYSGV